jgi:hypothetical protein
MNNEYSNKIRIKKMNKINPDLRSNNFFSTLSDIETYPFIVPDIVPHFRPS